MSIFFGVDYYPEHWPRERWETDASMMREMGLQVARLGEFSWARFEPRMGEFHFEWLDEAIEILGKNGISTVLGTPTAAPPAWIIEQNPEILPVDSDGLVKSFGGRHHDCQSNPAYREHVGRLVTAMAGHYRDNPDVIGWQIDNELGNSHENLCMCDSCKAHFQQWLKKKYKNVETLNREWGTCFWSQDYDKFEQVPVPRKTPTAHNPSLLLDWKRFCSDLIVDFQDFQVDIIREICPHHFITHNMMGLYDKTNYFDLGRNLDFASNDQYPTGYYFESGEGQPDFEISACLDFIRGVKKKNFWMMELEAGPTGGAIIGRTPRPGQLRLWTMHCVAHGADTIVYFRWRTCTVGTEQYWHGILPHSGIPGRRYEELKKTIAEMVPVMEDIHGVVTKAQVAVLFSYDQDWAFQIQPHHPELSYVDQIKKYYDGFYKRNVPMDFISEKDDFSAYRLVIAPLQILMTPELEEKFENYVSNGGNLVLTMRTGVKNINSVCELDRELPGNLGRLSGLVIRDYDCLLDMEVEVEWKNGRERGKARKWCDIVTLKGAEVLAEYKEEFYKDTPAITVNGFGKGKAFYIATEPDGPLMDRLADYLISELSLPNWGASPDGVELTVRNGRKNDYMFAINHTNKAQSLKIDQTWRPVSPGCQGMVREYGVEIFARAAREDKNGQ